MPTTLTLTDRLCALAREAADGQTGRAGPAGREEPIGTDGPEAPEAPEVTDVPDKASVLADRPDGTVVGLADVVAKAHPPAPETDTGELTVRLRVAAHPRLNGVMLPPLGPDGLPPEHPGDIRPLPLDGVRTGSLWPRGEPVDPDAPEAAPWAAAGSLLARLHSVPVDALADALPGPLPAMRGPAKAVRAMERMRRALRRDPYAPGSGSAAAAPAKAAAATEAAWATLPARCRNEEPSAAGRELTLCHGDFHLGQLVRRPRGPGGTWLLIDVDDLGLGDPAWDLARPAAWYATGLLPAPAWTAFLHAYQSRSGTSSLDPWPRLDAPARALTVQTAALAIAKATAAERPLDEAESACVEACERIADHGARTTGRNGP